MEFTDQLARRIQIPHWPPRRIISLVPSQTELLSELGLEEEVVGITKFCVHPDRWFRSKTRVGGTKTLHLPRIEQLAPDLILGNKEENDQSQIELLQSRFPVWMSDIKDLESALDMIRHIGQVTNRETRALQLAADIQRRFSELPVFPRLRAAYLIWRKPFMVAASDTFVDAMLQKAGFDNVFSHLSRYPQVDLHMLASAQPQVLFLSSEPYPFKAKHIAELQEICPEATIKLVDGELFSWYGSRLLHVPAYFESLRTDNSTEFLRI
ncbi:MAG: ABC transporter substrate-binding protein [Saprospiraceae bacterium]|nr:ABC transporter substrate-binding protein [Saprospiraceae bacterium]